MTLRLFITLLVLLLPIASAMGGELRVLTYSKETSDSRCIGNPVTPLCAVETMEACRIWADRKLCDMVGFDYERLGKGRADDYLRLWSYKYEIMEQQVLRADDIKANKRNRGIQLWRSGDIALRLWWEGYAPADRCVDESRNDLKRRFGEGCMPNKGMGREESPDTYILRRQGDGTWRLVGDFVEPILPEEFWKRK